MAERGIVRPRLIFPFDIETIECLRDNLLGILLLEVNSEGVVNDVFGGLRMEKISKRLVDQRSPLLRKKPGPQVLDRKSVV